MRLMSLKTCFTLSLLLMLVGTIVYSQDFNPPFPRTAFVSPAAGAGGTPDYFMAQYDLVANIKRQDEAKALNDSIRALNSKIIIVGTSQQGAWPGSDPPSVFAFHATTLKTQESISSGTAVVKFSFANDYKIPSKHRFALIGGDDWIEYRGYDENGFSGIPSSGEFAVSRSHPSGTEIRFPIRMSGFGMIPNLTEFAPSVLGKESWRWLIDERFKDQNFKVFDGISYDAYRLNFWSDDFESGCGVDFDYNKKDDLNEFGLKWLNERWADGVKKMLDYEHQKFSQLHPGKPSLIRINTGGAQDNYALDYCEGMGWEGFMRFATDWITMLKVNRKWEQKMKERGLINLTVIEDYERESRAEYGKNVFNRMRYGLTTSLLSGCFYGRTFGDYYYITYYHDEFDTDLGYPTSEAMELTSSGAWVRFFTHGAAICNPTARIITVDASELVGLPGYQGPYYRLRAGQDPEFNNGQLFKSVELYGEQRDPAKYNQGDGILLFKEPTTVVADILIGNTFNNDTSPGNNPIELEGGWREVQDPTGSLPFQDRMRCFSQWNQKEFNGSTINDGIGYAYSDPGDGSSKARFRPSIGVPGLYEIYEWHGWRSSSGSTSDAASNVPYKVVINGKTVLSGVIDQQKRIGMWTKIGVAEFPKGTESYVEISNKTNGIVFADAMRFRFLDGTVTPDRTPPKSPSNVRVEKY